MGRRAPIAGLSLICTVLTATAAHAQSQLPLELQWQAPAECPSAQELRAQLERIARVRSGVRLTKLAARAQVARSGAGYAVTLTTEHDGQDGERELAAADCETLARTVTLVLALAFGAGVEIEDGAMPDGTGEAGATPTSTSASTSTRTRTSTSTSTPTAPPADDGAEHQERAEDPGRAPAWALLAGGGAQFGLLPTFAFAAAVGVELNIRAFSIELRATGWPGVTQSVAPGLQAHFLGLAGAVQGCGRLPLAALTLALCAGARAAALHGRSTGATVDRSTTAPWYALSGAASLTSPRAGSFSVRIEVALAASLDRPRFVIENLAQVHRVPLLVPDVGALLVIAL